jgi:hypothetical protein
MYLSPWEHGPAGEANPLQILVYVVWSTRAEDGLHLSLRFPTW